MNHAVHVQPSRFAFTVVPGYGVASGKAEHSPYPTGTIALQKPFFSALGLDLSAYFNGTINAEFSCREVRLKRWDHEFLRVNWFALLPGEDFRFARCVLISKDGDMETRYPAYIYQVVAKSKVDHIQPLNVLELLAPEITTLDYGDNLVLEIKKDTLELL